MGKTAIIKVDLARAFKAWISYTDVKYTDPKFKSLISSADDNEFLMVTKTIGSDVTVDNVCKVDDDYIKKAVLGE